METCISIADGGECKCAVIAYTLVSCFLPPNLNARMQLRERGIEVKTNGFVLELLCGQVKSPWEVTTSLASFLGGSLLPVVPASIFRGVVVDKSIENSSKEVNPLIVVRRNNFKRL